MSTAALQKEQPGPKKFSDFHLQEAEFSRPRKSICVPEGWTLEDVLAPEAWANVAHKLKLTNNAHRTIVEMDWEDGSRYVEVIVMAVTKLAAIVKVVLDVDLTGAKGDLVSLQMKQADGKYEIKYRGGAGFGVIRVSDNELLHSGVKTRGECETWLEDYIKGMG